MGPFFDRAQTPSMNMAETKSEDGPCALGVSDVTRETRTSVLSRIPRMECIVAVCSEIAIVSRVNGTFVSFGGQKHTQASRRPEKKNILIKTCIPPGVTVR